MNQSIGHVTLVVRDYNEALTFFIDKLGFEILEDTPLDGEKRWVVVSPSVGQGAALLLAEATNSEQASHIGSQTGGRVAFFLQTDDFWRDYRNMQSRGVEFLEEPREEAYGTVVVFVDLYGNKWDLIEAKEASK